MITRIAIVTMINMITITTIKNKSNNTINTTNRDNKNNINKTRFKQTIIANTSIIQILPRLTIATIRSTITIITIKKQE